VRTASLLLVGSIAACTTTSEAPPAPAHRDDGPRFAVAYETPTASANTPGLAKVRVEPRGEFHMNLQYPPALELSAPEGVDVPRNQQRSRDAERFDAAGLVFAIPFTPRTGGKKRFGGTVEFAVCGELSCAPEKVPLDFTVDVGCDTDAFC
jgi:hypothetical protein